MAEIKLATLTSVDSSSRKGPSGTRYIFNKGQYTVVTNKEDIAFFKENYRFEVKGLMEDAKREAKKAKEELITLLGDLALTKTIISKISKKLNTVEELKAQSAEELESFGIKDGKKVYKMIPRGE